MVMCDRSFRLSGGSAVSCVDTASSVSLYKQKIDAMFDDNRSVTSYGGVQRRDSKVSSLRSKKASIISNDSTNSVQDRIEKMFAEMAVDSKDGSSEFLVPQVFTVEYLGSAPLHSKVTGLSGLQEPIKDLYFAYRRSGKHKMPASDKLEISKSGLRVKYNTDKGIEEQLNPFPNIAVWSAVKFSLQASERNNSTLQFAFLPLITDPTQIDKQKIFARLEDKDKKYIVSSNENTHSPIFAVVMRKVGVNKLLECHAFVCENSEDAIVIAATLYKTLVTHMTKENNKVKNKNGVTCMSIASSIPAKETKPIRPPRKKRSTSSLSGDSDGGNLTLVTDSLKAKIKQKTRKGMTGPLPPPPPPPNIEKLKDLENVVNPTSEINSLRSNKARKKTGNKSTTNSSDSSVASKVSDKIELFSQLEKRRILQRPPTLPPPIPTKNIEKTEDITEPLRRNHSVRKSNSDSGDILTKVAIPRSGSFLNAGGLTRYKSIGHRNNGKKGGGSPLGFHELFNEFKVQENLHSMDEILNAIINAEGMSFNDLKPIYKEFLLKLAVTLTKDEIFQHSKAIMKRQKKKILRRNSTFQNKRKKMWKGAYGLRMVFRKPFGKSPKLREKVKDNKYEFHSFAANVKNFLHSESSVSTSSYDLKQFRPKDKEPDLPPPKRLSVRKRNSKRTDKIIYISKRSKRPGERTSTSEDSDILVNARLAQNRNSSSGYVSCSECDSESCMNRCYCSFKADCSSKCYCSAAEMKNQVCKKNKSRQKITNCKECTVRECCYDPTCDLRYCSCDSDTCNESNKCYCRRDHRIGKVNASIKSSKSIEYIGRRQYCEKMSRAFEHALYDPMKTKSFRIRSNSTMGYSNFTERRWSSNNYSRGHRSRSADDLALNCQLLFDNKAISTAQRRNMKRLTVRSTGGQDALSVKKSAEMAALFADVHLSQRTDVRNLLTAVNTTVKTSNVKTTSYNVYSGGVYSPRKKSLSRKPSLEDTLGYLP